VLPLDLDALEPEMALVISALRSRYGRPDELERRVEAAVDPRTFLDLVRRHGVDPLVLQAFERSGVSPRRGT
jgi:hypothetical protein